MGADEKKSKERVMLTLHRITAKINAANGSRCGSWIGGPLEKDQPFDFVANSLVDCSQVGVGESVERKCLWLHVATQTILEDLGLFAFIGANEANLSEGSLLDSRLVLYR